MRNKSLVPILLFGLVLCALVTLVTPAPSYAQFSVSISFAPPALPVYEQPPIPDSGYMWTPGYWAYDPDYQDYYWVPGTWVQAPEPGYLWTPGYWGWGGNGFAWNEGYWGTQIGFYGGVNYGFGYTGGGYEGGYWNNGAFFYNRSVNNFTGVTNITNVYNKPVVNNVTVNNVSYNGGAGGITAQPTAQQQVAAKARHIPPTTEQAQHQRAASTNTALRASVNHGKPAIAATAKPGVFSGQGVVAARAAAPYHPAPVKATVSHPPVAQHENAPPVRVESRPPVAQVKNAPPVRVESRPPVAQAKNAPPARTESRPPVAQAKNAPPARTESRPPVAQAKNAPPVRVESRPPVAQVKNAPPPKAESRPSGQKPEEKPKEKEKE